MPNDSHSTGVVLNLSAIKLHSGAISAAAGLFAYLIFAENQNSAGVRL